MSPQTTTGAVYFGWRDETGCHVLRALHGQVEQLPLRLDLWNHSPDGFEWGYGGSGPAQLALALCADVLQNPLFALRVYQDVKVALVAKLGFHCWSRTEFSVREQCTLFLRERFPRKRRIQWRRQVIALPGKGV